MIKMPYEEVVEKIVSNTELSKDEIEKKIQTKMDQLSGLISKEGAAHIVANELNVKIFDAIPDANAEIKIKEVLPGLRNINLYGKVTRLFGVREFKVQDRSGKVGNLLIGDETGNIKIVIWGNLADKLNEIKEGDIIKITSGYSKENNGFKEIHLNDKSEVIINPEGISIDNVKAPVSNTIKKKISELQPNDMNVEIVGTIVDLFDIRYYEVCSECNRRVKEDTNYTCNDHPDSKHTYAYVLNGFVDDGSDNIRVVLFKERIENLLKKDKEEILKLRESPENFHEIKNNLLGSIVKLKGRVTKNDMFDRLEFVVNNIELNPDPEEEIKKIEE